MSNSTTHKVTFVKENKVVEVPHGANLRKCASHSSHKINTNLGINGIGAGLNKILNCHGFGMCGTCRVLVTKGMENTNPMTVREKIKFKVPSPDPIPCMAFVGHEDTMRLACMIKVLGDLEVETGPELDLFGENFFS
jgi:ferredoxin